MMVTSRLVPRARRSSRLAAAFLAVRELAGVAAMMWVPSQASDSGTRWGRPALAVATHTSASLCSRATVSVLRWLALRTVSVMASRLGPSCAPRPRQGALAALEPDQVDIALAGPDQEAQLTARGDVGVRALVRGQVEGGQRDPGLPGQHRALVAPADQHADDVLDPLVPGFKLDYQHRRVPADRLLCPAQRGGLVAFDVHLDEPHACQAQAVDGYPAHGDGPLADVFQGRRALGAPPAWRQIELRGAVLVGCCGLDHLGGRAPGPYRGGQVRVRLDAHHPVGQPGQPHGPRPVPGAHVDGGAAARCPGGQAGQFGFKPRVDRAHERGEGPAGNSLGRRGPQAGTQPRRHGYPATLAMTSSANLRSLPSLPASGSVSGPTWYGQRNPTIASVTPWSSSRR